MMTHNFATLKMGGGRNFVIHWDRYSTHPFQHDTSPCKAKAIARIVFKFRNEKLFE
jgi:hypothetical protein